MRPDTVVFCFSLYVSANAAAIASGRNSVPQPSTIPVRRAGQYRGTWTLLCNGSPSDPTSRAWGACNNACFSTRCMAGDSARMTLGADDPNDPLDHQRRNRINSGCNTKTAGPNGISVAKYSPFSQLFVDLPGTVQPTCDEWPMADTQQLPIGDGGRVPNSLRIMPLGENSSAGAQYNQFKANPPEGNGPLQPGDYWDFAWSDAGMSDADKSHIPYCYATAGTDSCNNDGQQFFATFIGAAGQGQLSAPYDYVGDDNNYKLSPNPGNAREKGNIRQCSLGITRYTGTVNWDIAWYWLPQALRGDNAVPDFSWKDQIMDLNQQITLSGPPQSLHITNVDNAAPVDGVTAVKLLFSLDADFDLSWTTPQWCSPQNVIVSAGMEAWSCDFPCFDSNLAMGQDTPA